MKARDLFRIAERVERREECLRDRFIDPIIGVTSWNPMALDYCACYVGLLHAEAEAALEGMVEQILVNSREKSEKHKAHPVLLNCVVYFSGRLKATLGDLGYIPGRSALKQDGARLVEIWDEYGVKQYYANVITGNHGAGAKYIEKLLHPLGVLVTPKTFKSLSSQGIEQLYAFGGKETTQLQELVHLRGLAMHASSSDFALGVHSLTPASIHKNGREATAFILSMGKKLAAHVL